MASKTCFVIMAIGDQSVGDTTITSAQLRSKYNDLIKEAILKVRPDLEVVRADDVALPGTITTDIITRLMHSDYVVADVTFPNPNVFYELGLRHACRTGTVILHDKSGPKVPFDIAHLRYVEYENTTAGLKALASHLGTYFDHFDNDPERPDNHFQELAKLTGYNFPAYRKQEDPSLEMQMIGGLLESPELIDILVRQQAGEAIDKSAVLRLILNNPKVAQPIVQALVASGKLSFASNETTTKHRKKLPRRG